MPLTHFHPAITNWFRATFPAPTDAQAQAWPAIHRGQHTLIAAPTGSGKTLAAFLAAIDDLVRQGVAGTLADETQVVYVSPLKALSNDIERNLQQPLAGIGAQLRALDLPEVDIRVQVRTGDTPAGERAAMQKRPPHILVTTPESLYLLLTSASGRTMLATTRTLIVDEIHAVAASKRGAHLALSLERLAALSRRPPVRIGLSATQKPIGEVARFLVGSDGGDCTIVDAGHVRARDLALELPPSPLEAVMAGEVWEQVYDRLAELIRAHRVTLVFANTRRLTERVTRHLSERLGKENVAAHHGSLSRAQRLDAEQRLKHGALRALVATASLELGLDIGDVELVINLGSPRSIATLLQRVGRANHAVGGTPKGRLFPLTRDELVECTALLAAVAGNGGVAEDELFQLVRRAHPYRELTHDTYLAVVRMLADGYSTRRGRAGAYLHRDAVHRRLRARKGARLTALTCGGAIPDNADYRVLLEPGETLIGTLNEDFAIESMAGDIFQLGNASYRILKIETGKVRVEDAKGAPPSIPFWFGEAPARTDELSQAVSALRAAVDASLSRHGTHIPPPIPSPASGGGLGRGSLDASWSESIADTINWVTQAYNVSRLAAEQLVEYLAASKGVLGVIPTQQTLVVERFFDESGGMQLVIHAPFGSRINRAWGLSLRKRFCRQFNFELQAAATEDSIVLSLGETHSFALDEVARYLHSHSVRDVLVQALLDAPLFTTRWRWNATIALAIKRARGGAKRPAAFQRMDAEDLIAVVFPDQIACAENLRGEREVPSHPLVDQTIADCLHEAMDVDGLIGVLRALERGDIKVLARDLPHPSPLAQEILNAKPYAFLDDAPLEERRTQAVSSRRWLDPTSAADLGRLDPQAIAQVATEAWPTAENADELHDALLSLAFVTETEGRTNRWAPLLDRLVRDGRATRVNASSAPHPNPPPHAGEGTGGGAEAADGHALWIAAESVPMFRALLPDAVVEPAVTVPDEFAVRAWNADTALVEIVRARLQGLGPVTSARLAQPLGVTTAAMDMALASLEQEGFVLRGRFTSRDWSERLQSPSALTPIPLPQAGEGTVVIPEWCERRLLARIHRYTIRTLRAEIEPVTALDFMRFLFTWHGLTTEPRPEGPQALATVIGQLEGYEAAAATWESDLLPVRLHDYDPAWLDSLCLSGRAFWARLTPPKSNGEPARGSGPVRATPIAFLLRAHRATWQALRPLDTAPPLSAHASAIAAYLRTHGASFFDELAAGAGLLRSQAEAALGELVAAGLVHADSFTGLRALLLPADRRRAHNYRRRRAPVFGLEDAGRWTLVPNLSSRLGEPTLPLPPLGAEGGAPYTDQGRPHPHSFSRKEKEASRGARDGAPTEDMIEQIARLLLARYGVVFRRLLEREPALLPPWYQLLRAYRRLEARGEIRGGRFVGGVAGEQYALPDAVGLLRETRRRAKTGTLVALSAVDPLNLVGVITPGARVPALAGNRVLYRDGEPIAIQTAGEVRFLTTLTPSDEWAARTTLQRSPLHDARSLRVRDERDAPVQ